MFAAPADGRRPRKEVLSSHMDVKRTGITLKPSNSRVVIRPFELANDNRVEKIIARISSLSEQDVSRELDGVMREFRDVLPESLRQF